MTSTGVVQLIHFDQEIERMDHLGYPHYFLTILGVSKLLGAIAVLVPKFPLIKEWAYAGFIFTMLGALYSHMAMNDEIGEYFPPIFLLGLTLTSYFMRPEDRRIS